MEQLQAFGGVSLWQEGNKYFLLQYIRQHQQGSNIEQVNYALTTSLSSEKSKEKLTTEIGT